MEEVINDESGEVVNDDPFGADYNIIQFTQLSRIYDALVTLIQIQDPTAAERLLAAHSEGKLLAPSPQFTGDFLHDLVNTTE